VSGYESLAEAARSKNRSGTLDLRRRTGVAEAVGVERAIERGVEEQAGVGGRQVRKR